MLYKTLQTICLLIFKKQNIFEINAFKLAFKKLVFFNNKFQPKIVELSESSEEEEEQTWFGITAEDENREARNLFVADRVLSETEKVCLY